MDRNIGCGFGAAEHDDFLSPDGGGVSVLRRMQDDAAGRLEGFFTGMADRLAFIELAGADCDEVKLLACDAAIGIPDLQRPARQARIPARHADDGGIEAHPLRQAVVPGVVSQIGMNLRSLGPFRIGVRHGLVGVPIEILRALGLDFRIGSRRLPDAAKIAAAFEDCHLVSASAECFCRG
jgi:hypothetical protein